MRYANASDVATFPYAVALTHLSEKLSDAELRAKYPDTSGTLIVVRGVLYYFDPTREAARVSAWHATFNAALTGSTARKLPRQEAATEAASLSTATHGAVPQLA